MRYLWNNVLILNVTGASKIYTLPSHKWLLDMFFPILCQVKGTYLPLKCSYMSPEALGVKELNLQEFPITPE